MKRTYVDKNGIDIIGAVVALKGSDVGPEIVSCKKKEKNDRHFMYSKSLYSSTCLRS